MGRHTQFALFAADEALAMAALDLDRVDGSRVASVVATGIADFAFLEGEFRKYLVDRRIGKTNPFTVPRVSTSLVSAHVAMRYGFTGAGYGLNSACSTGSHSIANGAMLLNQGLADVAVVGGTESAMCYTFFESYAAMRALSLRNDEPTRAMRPFDRDRDGFVIAEGAGVLVLETLNHAQARGADVLAELAGFGATSDAHHVTAPAPDGRGARDAMAMALSQGAVTVDQVDYISAHGTSTLLNDPIETTAIKDLFGHRAGQVPVSAVKSMIGHSIGAAGAIEAVVAVMCMQHKTITPTINLENPDPACDLDYVPGEAREAALDVVLSNSFAFGGQNCALLFRR